MLKLRLHLLNRADIAAPAPLMSNVNHLVPDERELIAVIGLAFENPLTRRAFLEFDNVTATQAAQKAHISRISAFAVSGVYAYVRDKQLTMAGLRGSRQAQSRRHRLDTANLKRMGDPR